LIHQSVLGGVSRACVGTISSDQLAQLAGH
jgi:hypothetical protein